MEQPSTFSAFLGTRRIAAGPLTEVLPALKTRFDDDRTELVLVFEDETGRQVDFDLRGSLEDVLERASPSAAKAGPGRPKLGVVSREVSLLPRHWEWLEQQPNGISAALRRLIDDARKNEPNKDKARRLRDAVSRFMTAMAGDLPHYEDATRALYNRDDAELETLMKRWPKDVREHVLELAHRATALEHA